MFFLCCRHFPCFLFIPLLGLETDRHPSLPLLCIHSLCPLSLTLPTRYHPFAITIRSSLPITRALFTPTFPFPRFPHLQTHSFSFTLAYPHSATPLEPSSAVSFPVITGYTGYLEDPGCRSICSQSRGNHHSTREQFFLYTYPYSVYLVPIRYISIQSDPNWSPPSEGDGRRFVRGFRDRVMLYSAAQFVHTIRCGVGGTANREGLRPFSMAVGARRRFERPFGEEDLTH